MTQTMMVTSHIVFVAISVYLAHRDWGKMAARVREGPRGWLARLWRFITTPAGAATGLLIVGLMVALFHFYLAQDWSLRGFIDAFYANFSVEFISIAITVLIIDRLYQVRQREQERQLNIQRWQEEIEDYLGWDEKEATYRIVGNIRRLNREGVSDIWLGGAFLQDAGLIEADLIEADLTRANLQGASLDDAHLQGATLSEADLSEAVLLNATLSGAVLTRANLSKAQLRGANLSEADLRRADLSEADLSEAVLTRANLQGASLGDAHLQGADLSEANLREATLMGANLIGANLSEADLIEIDLSEAVLSGAKYNTMPYDEFSGFFGDPYHQPTQWPGNFDPVAAGAIDVSKEGD